MIQPEKEKRKSELRFLAEGLAGASVLEAANEPGLRKLGREISQHALNAIKMLIKNI